MPGAAYVFLRRWVLRPIGHLRRQLRAAAGDIGHETAITPVGPPELRDLGADAETLRRNLVGQIDEVSAATSALEQEGPVVSAIRTELNARTEASPIGLQVAGALRPAEGVIAGDFWDRMPLGDGRTAVMICDVSGHGARAGIVALRLKTAITMGLLAGNDPATIFHRACDSFSDEPSRFATAVIMVVDPRTGVLTWVNAGHPQPRVLRGSGRVEHLGTTGPMLSWLGGNWRAGQTKLGPNDVTLGFTDGVLESRNADGTELGDEGLDERLKMIREITSEPAEVLVQALAGIRERADDLGRDDLTMIAFRLDPTGSAQIPIPR
jgi:serine phosphatase RsbU (regulator of sigma subunit)